MKRNREEGLNVKVEEFDELRIDNLAHDDSYRKRNTENNNQILYVTEWRRILRQFVQFWKLILENVNPIDFRESNCHVVSQ